MGGVQVRDAGDGERAVHLVVAVFDSFRRHGVGLEASRLALDYARREMGATHVYLTVDSSDPASLGLARGLGAPPRRLHDGVDRVDVVARLDLSMAS